VIEFKRNKDNGKVEVWKDGKKIGEIETIGDEVSANVSNLHRPQRGGQ
jgi:hypothetical protein